ncbi:hypothetical protein FOA52_014383 [Chlamydomonas sp. UWO 241]|nr:hypothetical protein FOA52_014383 [Chlamydomonas sp. UWO 241]
MVSKTMPVEKLQTSAGLGAMVGITAVLIAVLCHKDPWGGATLSLDSLAWAGGGLVAGLPLVALRAWTWTPAASKVLPVVDDMHRSQMQVVAPWFTGMDRVHVVIMMAMEVLPLTLLLLPAAQGVVQGIAQLYAQVAGAVDPSLLPDVSAVDSVSGNLDAGVLVTRLVGLAATAGVAGAARGMELSISGDEYDAVSSAMENSDRYYRLTAMDVRSRKEDGDRASLAFRAVAQVYLDTRSDATILAAGLAAVDVMYLGGLWYATGNLAAPAAAALAVNWVEYGNLHARIGGTPANAKE